MIKVCGAKTAIGGSCKLRVNGGGQCAMHRRTKPSVGAKPRCPICFTPVNAAGEVCAGHRAARRQRTAVAVRRLKTACEAIREATNEINEMYPEEA